MTPAPRYRLGNLQLEIMQVLWERGEARVGEVHEALGASAGLAYTTVATMLRKMEDRGLVTHEAQGRSFLYRAAVTEEQVSRDMAGDLLDRVFSGSLSAMVSHLLTTREVGPGELKRLEQLISQRRKKP
jgi:BlaI family penicillinase repressor